jgi:Tol biopolymer transport system component
LRQLTSGGCCVQPFFSPDSRMVLFIDRPDASAPAGLYGVPVEDGTTTLITERLGAFSADLSLRAFPSGGGAVIERLSDGQRWTVANGGREVSFSPDNAWVAWTSGQTGTNLDAARRQVWAAKTDGSAAHVVVEVTGGGFSGWLPDGRLLVTARLPGGDTGLFAALPGARTEALPELPLASGQRLRSLAVSPSGRWLAMLVTFSSDPAEDGVWVVDLQNGDRRKIEPFGAYRWRGDQLLLAPFEPGAASHRLLQIDPTTGLATAITDPALMPFKIANGDWRVSPDGRWMVFVSAQDQNLWLVKLPD